ncbi:MAG TPA: sigma factor, partial [Quisquiliibacterium sp.]|nr:sigma factor [Quisquiliibacterium sp.]
MIADEPQADGFAATLVALLPRLRRYARTLVHEPAAADDLVQDTLERAWARRAQWIPGSDLRAWLFAIMHNRRIDLLRGDRTVATDDDTLQDLADAAEGHAHVEP